MKNQLLGKNDNFYRFFKYKNKYLIYIGVDWKYAILGNLFSYYIFTVMLYCLY